MAIRFDVARADLTFESGFSQPEFALFRDTPGLFEHLFAHLKQDGLRLSDMKIEQGAGNAADFHVLCYLFNFTVTIRIRLERIEVLCSNLTQDYVQKVGSAIINTLGAVQSHLPDISFLTHALALGLHGILQGELVRQYVSGFATNVPSGIGPLTGNGAVFYFGPEGDRLLSSITVDRSVVVPDGLYVRPHVVWDAKKVDFRNLPEIAEGFVRHALNQIGLELPQ